MTTLASSLVVSEVFGPTVQGEGPNTGRRASFIRLGGCNLSCSWCDTAYTWDASRYDLRAELNRRETMDVVSEVLSHGTELAVISGGEPLLQDRHGYGLRDLVMDLPRNDVEVNIETNGTVAPSEIMLRWVDLFVVSPKLAHAGMTQAQRIKPETLTVFARLAPHHQAIMKVVCRTPRDVEDTALLADSVGWPRSFVWVMPEGTDAWTVLERGQALAGPTIEAGMNVTTRLHTLLWGKERGR